METVTEHDSRHQTAVPPQAMPACGPMTIAEFIATKGKLDRLGGDLTRLVSTDDEAVPGQAQLAWRTISTMLAKSRDNRPP